jgi:hypothetical protein
VLVRHDTGQRIKIHEDRPQSDVTRRVDVRVQKPGVTCKGQKLQSGQCS